MLSLFEASFYLAYFLLAGSSVLTGIEIFNYYPKKYQVLKYILAIETTVNLIASVAYNNLLKLSSASTIDYGTITSFRYLDWICTTPLLLISLTLYLEYQKNQDQNHDQNQDQQPKFNYSKLGIIILLNIFMLLFGYLGETNKINYILACILGFIPFFIMFYLIWKWYGNYNKNITIYTIFVFVWSLYGIVYFLPKNSKNISYNILDIIAKVGFGILIWFEVVNLRFNNQI